MDSKRDKIWVFHGAGGRFSSGIFSSIERAEAWIKNYKLTGVLTEYPVDQSAYDWSIATGAFEVQKEAHTTADFIQRFTSASQEHYHYEEGERDS